MQDRPLVALVLPKDRVDQMFARDALDSLRQVAEVVGPLEFSSLSSPDSPWQDATVAITGWGSKFFDEATFDAARNLKLISHSAGTVRGLISESVFDRGIRVTTAAAANATPVAEFTVAAMVMLLKQIPWIADAFKNCNVEEAKTRRARIRELRDISVGLIGASRVGREVIRLLKSYPRVQIKLHDPHLKREEAAALGVELVSLEGACRCEVVSIHAPKIPATHHMFNAKTLSLLPDHAVLINTSRGSLVDEAALIAEVRRRPLYVLLDVTDPEPPSPDSPLRREKNILLTPHIAGSMNQARRDMGRLAIEETIRFLRGQPLEHEVTREMLPTQA